jgi:plasmid stabilization system protein ParE
MFGSALLKCSEHQRPFWLTVALSIMLLASVSITIAQAAHPSRLAYDLKRDLGALRAQLELIDPWDQDAGRQSVASNTDLGDGSPAFQRHSMVTIAGAANRRLERLLDSYLEQGSDARARTAEALRLALYDLRHQIDQLARAADPAEAVAVRERIGTLLDRSERELTALLGGVAKPPALPAVVAPDPAPIERAR